MKSVNSVEVWWGDSLVGKILTTRQGLCAFEYNRDYIESGVSVSPFELPLRPGVFMAKPFPFDGGFGVFDDSLPDGWGLLILDRFLQKKGIDPRNLTFTDRLSLVGTSGRGALEFRPDQSVSNDREFSDFESLAREAEEILRTDDYVGDGIEELYKRGGSPGGARPKIFVEAEGKEWLVKFRATNDPENIGAIEYEYSLLAKKCGVEMPETRLFEGKFFGVERFDRKGKEKIHVVSMAGLLNADYRIPSIDYIHIFKVGRALTGNEKELWKIYRLMVFNFLIGNKDDHAKNFAFIYKDGKWQFAPAFDLLPSGGMNGYHTTSINDKIDPGEGDLLEVARKMSLDEKKAGKILEEQKEIISRG